MAWKAFYRSVEPDGRNPFAVRVTLDLTDGVTTHTRTDLVRSHLDEAYQRQIQGYLASLEATSAALAAAPKTGDPVVFPDPPTPQPPTPEELSLKAFLAARDAWLSEKATLAQLPDVGSQAKVDTAYAAMKAAFRPGYESYLK